MPTFTEKKQEFDNTFGKSDKLLRSLVPVDGNIKADILLKDPSGKPLEEYYKWQFIYSLINSGLYPKDFIGVENYFPKGTIGANPIKIDACIFDDKDWYVFYNTWKTSRDQKALDWLRGHLISVIEFKREDGKDIEAIFNSQIKAYIKESEVSYVLGMYYDKGRLYLFHRRNGAILRYDESKNLKKEDSKIGDLCLHLTDPYYFIPSFDDLLHRVNRPAVIDRTNRTVNDLDVITSISTTQVSDAMSHVLRTLDKAGLVNQRGYEILIQIFALKIFDEKRNERNKTNKLQFYINEAESHYKKLSDSSIRGFVKRMQGIYQDAEGNYKRILQDKQETTNWKNENHVKAVVAVVESFQDYSFVRSQKSDLYQLVFYNFANEFKKDEKAQFLTPLPLIDFLVRIVNPRDGETLLDPCCGIADFLSLSYVNSNTKLDDANIYGVDLDENMVMLAQLNMLLNGDGEAKLLHKPDKGSILWKIAVGGELVELDPEQHKGGNWDNWADRTKLMKFDVVLTNPPFGENRAYTVRTTYDKEILEMYETWNIARQIVEETVEDEIEKVQKGSKRKNQSKEAIDLGILFLENAYRELKINGRLGIVLSNSISSVERWATVRRWLMERMRIVALFDLPPNVFAETGVNISIIVTYKPSQEELGRLNEQGYSIFIKDIQNVGYEKRTSKRNVFFNPVYRIDEQTFDIMIDSNGNPILDEDFSSTVLEFREWALGQEKTLQELFLEEK